VVDVFLLPQSLSFSFLFLCTERRSLSVLICRCICLFSSFFIFRWLVGAVFSLIFPTLSCLPKRRSTFFVFLFFFSKLFSTSITSFHFSNIYSIFILCRSFVLFSSPFSPTMGIHDYFPVSESPRVSQLVPLLRLPLFWLSG